MRPKIAVFSPAKAPDDPIPSGERTIVRALRAALAEAGFETEVASTLRLLDKAGDAVLQQDLIDAATAERQRVLAALATSRPALWLTYHGYYKCPDLLGPGVARRLGIPYAIVQPTLSPKRLHGPWAGFAQANAEAVGTADCLFWTTARDLPALEAARLRGKLVALPPFLASLKPANRIRSQRDVPLFATVAMMRPGDKLESYRRLARALAHVRPPWRLEIAGDGPARAAVEASFASLAGTTHFLGALEADGVADLYDRADLLVWPGVGEGVGMTYLEAQAHGLPVVAENHAAQRDVIAAPLAAPGDAQSFADAIHTTLADLPARSAAARAHIESAHTLETAARTLGQHLRALL